MSDRHAGHRRVRRGRGRLLAWIAVGCAAACGSEPSAIPADWPFALDVDPVRAAYGMVVSTDRYASDVGVEILQSGGNAVDAAVATSFALAVVNPEAGNIGDGGFLLVRFADGATDRARLP